MAREVTVKVGGKDKHYTVSPLKGKHIRELMKAKKQGFEETFQVLEMAGIPEADANEMDFKDCLMIQKEINAETFGIEEEVKN